MNESTGSTADPTLVRDGTKRIRKAFAMQLKSGTAAEYERRHTAIWPELVTILKAHGVHNYSIFRCESPSALFAYVEIDDPALWATIGLTEVGQRWRIYMSDLLVTHPDLSPVVIPLQEAFHLD